MRLWLRSILTLALVTFAGFVLDGLLRHEGMARRDLLVISDLLVGLVAAILAFIIGRHQEQRNRFVSARLRVISEMNHHIRNALQVITFQARFGRNENEIRAMQDAVNRITWALSEVLPRLPDFRDPSADLNQKTSAAAANLHPGENSASR